MDLVLYERILSQKELNAKSAEYIRGKEFKVASKYYLYRIKLAERIIQSLVSFESAKVSALSFIRRAVTMDAVELAEKSLADEMIKAQENEDFSTLRYLYDFANELEQDYSFRFSYHPDLKSRETVKHLDEVQHSLEDLLVQIRKYFPKGKEARRMGAAFLSSRLEEIEPETQKAHFTFDKVQVGLSLLPLENPFDAEERRNNFELQKGLVERMLERASAFTTTRLSKEILALIKLSEIVGDRETALHYNTLFSQLTPQTLIEQKEFTRTKIIQTTTVGEFWANLSLAEKGLKELRECQWEFTNSDLAKCFLRLGLNFFYNGEVSTALSCFQEVRRIPSKEWDRISWEPDVLVLLCNMELGNHDVLDSLARTAYRTAKKYDLAYAKKVVSIINQILRSNPSELDNVYRKGLNDIIRLNEPTGDVMISHFFDMSIWLHSKLKRTNQADLFSHIGKLRYQQMGELKYGT